jgi:Cyclin, N-terminal domain
MSSNSSDPKPLISIRINRPQSTPLPTYSLDESCEAISILRRQDLVYKCQDYFALYSERDSDIDPRCREKMCEWCYRVCDCGIFPCDREMVAVAFSFIDRFMLRKSCNRATFKLAAVTSFYLATKILSHMQMRIECLVELGRGSFDGNDIQNMEHQLLEKLEWRLNPPTTQAFVRQLWTIAPATLDPVQRESIYHRAIFFAELSVYDYGFVTKDRHMVAVACVLNAMETEQDSMTCDLRENETLRELSSKFVLEVDRQVLERAQAQLWYLYSCSAQLQEEENVLPLAYFQKHTLNVRSRLAVTCHRHSPVSVRFKD